MIISAFRRNQNSCYLYLFLITLVLRLIPALHPAVSKEVRMFEPYMGTFLPFHFSFLSNHLINLGIAGALVYLQALILNQILIRYNIFTKPTFIPALLYVLISSMFSSFLSIQPVLMVNFIILWLLERIFAIYKTDNPIARAFDLGLIIAAGTFIYFPLISLLPLVWISLSVFLPFSWRSWLSGLLGFLILYLFMGVYYFYTDNFNEFLQIFRPFDLEFKTRLDIPLLDLFTLVPMILITGLSVHYYRVHFQKNLIQVRKSLSVLLLMIILSGAGFYLQPLLTQYSGTGMTVIPRYSLLHFLVWAAPLSIYSSYYFIFAEKRWLYEGLFLILFSSILIFQIA